MQTAVSREFVEGIFLRELKNRFLCEVELQGEPTVCYVPSSCHLGNFLQLQGKRVLLIRNQGGATRTQFALFALPYMRSYILLSPAAANQAVAASLSSRRFAFLGSRKHYQAEHKVDGYKADLYIEDTRTVVEVKAVITTDSEAVFPTVYSERTLRQLSTLEKRLDTGMRACLMIVSLNPYVRQLRIDTRSEFGQELEICISKGLMIRAFCCRYTTVSGIKIDKNIPVVFGADMCIDLQA